MKSNMHTLVNRFRRVLPKKYSILIRERMQRMELFLGGQNRVLMGVQSLIHEMLSKRCYV